ncbi:MAG: hypothetical protein M1828_005868 [Chrysothrix sp. TS-e1954]|nr:MAG: hypothetical protein M1828_005868 [Chrysothrix sp. TS-e1954]
MASGYGNNGGPGRCFPFWQEVLACYVVNSSSEDGTQIRKCGAPLEDYYECLHHRKEHAKARAMQVELYKKLKKQGRDAAPSQKEVRKLGLIPDQKPEDVDIKEPRWIPNIGPRIV